MKKRILYVLLFTLSIMMLFSCSNGYQGESVVQGASSIKYGDVNSYKYYTADGNVRFKVISIQLIDDGQTNNTSIYTLVDTETKVMYMQTTKYQMGYGLSTVMMVDENGKPLLYEGEL